jgi:glycosyltransferase involved in cell wall biosynthesis
MKYIINGNFLYGSVLGVQRYAREITAQLDKKVKDKPYQVEIVMPSVDIDKTTVFEEKYQAMYENIKIVVIGGNAGRKWDQVDFNNYVKKFPDAKPIYLCNEVSLFMKNGIVVVHDIAFKSHPEFFKEPGDWHEIIFRKMMYRKAFKKADAVLTVSEFSKNEILENYKLKNPDITVAGNGWQHFNTDNIDEFIFDKYATRVKRGNYYFYMASLAPNKNLGWIMENAKNNPECTYVIAGKSLGDKSDMSKLPNVVYVGYVSDATAKALMKYCKAFLFPSTYEGFGIPPMEALCMGAKIVLGDIPVLHEIYGNVAKYINCNDPATDLNMLVDGWYVNDRSVIDLLKKHSWEKSAAKLCECMDREAV